MASACLFNSCYSPICILLFLSVGLRHFKAGANIGWVLYDLLNSTGHSASPWESCLKTMTVGGPELILKENMHNSPDLHNSPHRRKKSFIGANWARKHRGLGDHEALLDVSLTFLVTRSELEILEVSQGALEYVKNSEKKWQCGKFYGYKCVRVYTCEEIPLSEHNFCSYKVATFLAVRWSLFSG